MGLSRCASTSAGSTYLYKHLSIAAGVSILVDVELCTRRWEGALWTGSTKLHAAFGSAREGRTQRCWFLLHDFCFNFYRQKVLLIGNPYMKFFQTWLYWQNDLLCVRLCSEDCVFSIPKHRHDLVAQSAQWLDLGIRFLIKTEILVLHRLQTWPGICISFHPAE